MYSRTLEASVMASLISKSEQPLEQNAMKTARIMVLELDGVRVQGQPVAGVCEGVELKTALIYPMRSPSQRTRVASLLKAKDFVDVTAGLLRQAGVRQQDQLIAVSDGATWIADLLKVLGISQILDVFHAAQYFEQVLRALGWDDDLRTAERRLLLRGEIDMGIWYSMFLRSANVDSWSEEATTALQYLQARTHLMTPQRSKLEGIRLGVDKLRG